MIASPHPSKLYQLVADSIARDIEVGRYLPGQKLPPERELTESFNVSRPTVREAMIALEIRGLVEGRLNSGFFVAPKALSAPQGSDPDIGAFELTEARKLFEGEVAALAAKTITADQVSELYSLLADMDRDYERDAMNDSADRAFHVSIARATRNTALVFVVETLWDLRYTAPLSREIFKRARTVGISAFASDHRTIVDALKAGDPAAARSAMQAHLGNVMDELFQATELEILEKAKDEMRKKREELLFRADL